MEAVLSLPITGILITIICYMIGVLIRKLIPSPLTNPLVIANVMVILVVLYTPIGLEQYLAGGNIITMFIGPVTVILAMRIYRQRALLKANIIPILGGCIAGSAASLFSVWLLSRLFDLDNAITMSMLPKSVTTAIAIELARMGGGFQGLAVAAVILTGTVSAMFGPFFIKVFKLKDPLARGVALGSSGHAVATSAAIELGETEGAMSGLAMCIMGIATSVICIFLL